MGRQREALVQAALAQKGAASGQPFVKWYNQTSGRSIALSSAWCAIFVSWCARQAGISEKALPTFSGCTAARNVFRRAGVWRERDGYTPRRGDLIFFDWDKNSARLEHVGIVTGADKTYVFTIEGNTGNPKTVREKRYDRRSAQVAGYAAWTEGKEDEDMTKSETQGLIDQAIAKLRGELSGQKAPVYNTLEEVPTWGRPTVQSLVVTGRLRGNQRGELELSHDLLRALVIMERGEGVCR